jgi:hypothetical protein
VLFCLTRGFTETSRRIFCTSSSCFFGEAGSVYMTKCGAIGEMAESNSIYEANFLCA